MIVCILLFMKKCKILTIEQYEQRKSEQRDLRNKQLECLRKQIEQDSVLGLNDEFLLGLKEQFDYWVKNLVSDKIKFYSNYDYIISNKVVFNKEKNQGIGFVIRYRGDNETFDDVKILMGEKIKDKWYYYYKSYFVMEFTNCPLCKNGEPIPQNYMEERMFNLLVGTLSYYKEGTCNINNEFYTRRINDKVRGRHKEFIKK